MAAFVDPFGDQTVGLVELERRAEQRNPARHNHAHYFSGSVEEAIAESKARQGFLVIFLKGGDEESYVADETVHVSLGWQPVNCIALKLHDDLSNPHPQSFAKGKAFREIFPNIKQLPFLMVLSPEGQPLASLQGTDVAKYASQVIQKTAQQYPLKDDDTNSSASAATQHPMESPRPRTPVSPLVETPRSDASKPSNAASQINAALNAAAGAPSMFPHTDVRNLAHALMAASQQAAHAAALTATPSAREGGNAPLPEAPVITSPSLPAIPHSPHASRNLGEPHGMFAQQSRATTPESEVADVAQSAPHVGSGQAASEGSAPSEVLTHRDADLVAEREVMSQHMPVKTTTAPSAASEDFAFAPHKRAAEVEQIEPATWKRGSQSQSLPSSSTQSGAQRAKALAPVGHEPAVPHENAAAVTKTLTANERQTSAPGAAAAAAATALLPLSHEGSSTKFTNTSAIPGAADKAVAAAGGFVGTGVSHSGKSRGVVESHPSQASRVNASAPEKTPFASTGQAAPILPAGITTAAHSTPSRTENGAVGPSKGLHSRENKTAAPKGGISTDAAEQQLQRRDLVSGAAQKLPVHSNDATENASAVSGEPYSVQHKAVGHTATADESSPPVATNIIKDGNPQATEKAVSSSGRTSLAIRLTDGSFIRTDFSDDDCLSAVFDYIDANYTDGSAAYVLRTPFPYRYLERSNGDETLRSLDLCPRSLLALHPRRDVTANGVTVAGSESPFDQILVVLKKWLAALILAAVGFFAGLFRVPEERNTHTVQQGPPSHIQPPSTHLLDADATPFKLQGGTVFEGSKDEGVTLRQRRKDGDPGSNTYANGNSTEFKGDE